jgi:hypothetical protein
LANKFQLSNLHKSITKLYQEAKSVDFIYDKGQGKVAVEVELHIKTLNRYFISKHYQLSVFKRINRDFGKGLFKRLEY